MPDAKISSLTTLWNVNSILSADPGKLRRCQERQGTDGAGNGGEKKLDILFSDQFWRGM